MSRMWYTGGRDRAGPAASCRAVPDATFHRRRISMSRRGPARGAAKPGAKAVSPYGYPFWEWVAREDPEYVRARQPLIELSSGEGKELSVKHREMVIIGILVVSGSLDGMLAYM